jgi:hypothetical protein
MTYFANTIVPCNWGGSDPAITEYWIYVVGDGTTPGSYERIDEYSLQQEGSAKLGEDEDPEIAARGLIECLKSDNPGIKVALVVKIVDEDSDEIHTQVVEVFNAQS